MALYVSVCLLGALIAAPEESVDAHVIPLVWGVTVGLALAHWFAFRLSVHLFAAGKVAAEDLRVGGAQLLSGIAVAVVVTVPVVALPASIQLDVVEALLAVVIAAAGYVAARSGGAPRVRALVYGLLALIIALVIAVVKNRLSGH